MPDPPLAEIPKLKIVAKTEIGDHQVEQNLKDEDLHIGLDESIEINEVGNNLEIKITH